MIWEFWSWGKRCFGNFFFFNSRDREIGSRIRMVGCMRGWLGYVIVLCGFIGWVKVIFFKWSCFGGWVWFVFFLFFI